MSTQSSILSFFGRASSYPPAKRLKADTKSNDTTTTSTTTTAEPSKPEPKPPSPSPSPEREGPDFDDDTLVLQDGRSALLKDFDIGTIFTPSTRVYAPARRTSTTPRPSISRTSSLSSEPKSPERQLLGLSTPPSSPSKQHRSGSPSKHTNNTRSVPSSPTKMPKKRKLEQLFLDFGQKNLESTTCAECGMVYSVGVPSDEQLHRQYHGSRAATLRIPKWKAERRLRLFDDSGESVIAVMPATDHHFHVQRVSEILSIVDEELGIQGHRLPYMMLFYLSKQRRVLGCVAVDKTTTVYRMGSAQPHRQPPPQQAADEPSHVETYCGVHRLWVDAEHRRKGVATRLLDTLRDHFDAERVLCADELAFSQPTLAGQSFAESYTGRSDFLVYI